MQQGQLRTWNLTNSKDNEACLQRPHIFSTAALSSHPPMLSAVPSSSWSSTNPLPFLPDGCGENHIPCLLLRQRPPVDLSTLVSSHPHAFDSSSRCPPPAHNKTSCSDHLPPPRGEIGWAGVSTHVRWSITGLLLEKEVACNPQQKAHIRPPFFSSQLRSLLHAIRPNPCCCSPSSWSWMCGLMV